MTTEHKPVVRRNGKVYINGRRVGEVQDNGFNLSSQRTGRVWQYRKYSFQRWQGFAETRREAVADLLEAVKS